LTVVEYSEHLNDKSFNAASQNITAKTKTAIFKLLFSLKPGWLLDVL